MAKRWTVEEIQFLQDNYNKKSVEFVAEKLNRTVDAVQWQASKLDIKYRDKKDKPKKIKYLISFTENQAEYLNQFRNKSEIVREALSYYMTSQKKKKSKTKR